jgi:hypothetical protein
MMEKEGRKATGGNGRREDGRGRKRGREDGGGRYVKGGAGERKPCNLVLFSSAGRKRSAKAQEKRRVCLSI